MKYSLAERNGKKLSGLYGVYKIINLKTKDFYIGSGILKNRFNDYRTYFNKKKVLSKSWLWENNNKLENFEFEVIEFHQEYNSDYLKEREQYYFDTLNPTLNKSKNSKTSNIFFNKPHSNRKPILQLDLNGNPIKEWDYLSEVDKYGFDHRAVIKCCQGKNKTHKGYKWQYRIIKNYFLNFEIKSN